MDRYERKRKRDEALAAREALREEKLRDRRGFRRRRRAAKKAAKIKRRREKREARRERRRRRGTSVRFRIAAAFSGFTALLLLLINVYPVLVTRDLVFETKKSALQSQGLVISSSLSALDGLTPEAVAQVMELLDVTPVTRILVTDAGGRVLYDTSEQEDTLGRYAMLSEIAVALEGKSVFSCRYTGNAFASRAAVPVVSGGVALGAVYLYENDAGQGEIIRLLQRDMRTISAVAAGVGFVVIFVISSTLTSRIKRLTAAVGVVSSGDYAYRIPVRGGDEIAKLSSEFNVLTGRLESTEEARRRFVSDASHELRTPLAAIRLLSDSITQSDDMDVETMREFASDIGSEADRLQRITEKLMNLTKLDSGVSQTTKERVDMKLVAERALHLLSPLATAQRVTLRTELGEGCVIRASADDLYQIIFNLVENGIKYNVAGGFVLLRLRREKTRAVMTVSDTGIGIPEADLDHIFDRFYRVDKARSRASGGSGLGLAIVHEAVRANGGTIAVSRTSRGGTAFTVTFPISRRRDRGT